MCNLRLRNVDPGDPLGESSCAPVGDETLEDWVRPRRVTVTPRKPSIFEIWGGEGIG